MKKFLFFFVFLSTCLSSEAQKFIRYHMNNDTYNGFYTESIDSILHDYKNGIATSFIQTSGKMYEIPTNDIDSISIESASFEDGDVGQYRIYELNYDEGDVKKIYVDNRASLFASHNGDFGANDTILFSSAYNNIIWIFFTNEYGDIKKFYDGNNLFFLDYSNEGEITILDLSTGTTSKYIETKESRKRLKYAPSDYIYNFFNRLSQLREQLDAGRGPGNVFATGWNLAKNIEAIHDNPEFHHQALIADGFVILNDIRGITSAVGELWATEGLYLPAWGEFLSYTVSIFNDGIELIEDIWPDSEQMQRYKDYYQNKYSIRVATRQPENVSYTSAELRGEATSFEGLNGTFTFSLYGYGIDEAKILTGTTNHITNNSCIITANASQLESGAPHYYSVQYTCIVDGLQLVYYADHIAEFMTLDSLPTPIATTGDCITKTTNSATVSCTYDNVLDGSICGVEYSWNGGSKKQFIESTNGTHSITLRGLIPGTSYTYRAYIEDANGQTYYGETKTFITEKSNPIATTGDYSNVTKNSATVSCTYENVPEGSVCGVEYTWSGGSSKQSAGSGNGTQSITLSGLEPGTSYTYRAYIETNGQTYYGGNKAFTTDEVIPDLTGTWTCMEYRVSDGTFKERSTITLKSDGSASYQSEEGTPWKGSWIAYGNGTASVNVYFSTETTIISKNIKGTVNNVDNPTSIEGSAMRSTSHVMGGYSEYHCTFIMTKQ